MIKDMTTGSEARLIFKFTVPMLIGNVFQQLYSIIDAIIVGRFVGRDALAAVGTSFPIMFLLVALIMGLAMGSSIVVSQLFGAGQLDKMKKAVSTTIIFLGICSIGVSIIGVLSSRWLLILLQTPDAILDSATQFLNIIFGGMIFMFAYNAFSAILRGLGDSKTPLYFLVLSTFVNIVLDYIFVVWFGWGVNGTAVATVISQAVSSILIIVYIYNKIEILRLKRSDWVFDREAFEQSVRLGIPSSIQQTIVSVGMMAIQGLVNSYGSVTIAAYTAASRIDAIAMMPIMNLGMAVSTFAGQNIGAGKIDRVRRGLKASLIMTTGVCIFTSLLIFFAGPYMIGMFVDKNEATVIAQGTEYIVIVSFFYILMGLMFVINGVLRGAGDVVVPMISTVISLGMRIISGYALAAIPAISYRGIWWSIPIGWTFGIVIAYFRYKTGRWKEKAIAQSINPKHDNIEKNNFHKNQEP